MVAKLLKTMAKPALVTPDTGTESQDPSWPDHPFKNAKKIEILMPS
jgi:hypothetical protein